MEVMYYNEDWLTELGYDGPPESWEEFEEMACKASDKPFSGATGEGGRWATSTPWTPPASPPSSSAVVVTSSARQGTEYVFNSQAGVDTLTFWQDLTEKGCAKQATETLR